MSRPLIRRRLAAAKPKNQFAKQEQDAQLRRKAPTRSGILPAWLLAIGDMAYLEDVDELCECIGKSDEYAFLMGNVTGERYAVPGPVLVEVL